MKSRVLTCITAMTLFAALAITVQLAAQDHPDHQPTIITFDAPGAGQGTFAGSINPKGEIAGFSRDSASVRHGYVRSSKGDFTTFDAPGAGTGTGQGTRAYSINPAGTIAGYAQDASDVVHGFLRAPDGTITTFDAPGAGTSPFQGTYPFQGQIINPAGAITGFYVDSSDVSHGFLRAPDGTITGFDPTGSLFTFPLAINPAGAITGQYCDGTNCRGFLRAPDGTMTTFDVSGGVNGTFPFGINPAGVIVGYALDASNVYHGFLRARDGTITTFDAPGAGTVTDSFQGTFPFGINPAGAIVGYALDASNVFHGFLRDRDGNFTTFDAPGAGNATDSYQGTLPTANNPSGKITGSYVDSGNLQHGFLRTPKTKEE
jgi:hypothetical protein